MVEFIINMLTFTKRVGKIVGRLVNIAMQVVKKEVLVMMRDIYQYELLSARLVKERLAEAAQDRLRPPSLVVHLIARWIGLRLIQAGWYFVRYAETSRSVSPRYLP